MQKYFVISSAMEKDNSRGGMDDTEIHDDKQPSTSAKLRKLYVPQIRVELLSSSDKRPSTSRTPLPRIKVNLVTPSNPRKEPYMPSKYVCSVLRKFFDGEYGDIDLEDILIMPPTLKRPAPPSLGEASNSKKICCTVNSSVTSDPPVSSDSDPAVISVPDHTISSDNDPSILSNSDAPVSSNPDHIISSNADPSVSSNADPSVSSNPDHIISSNADPSVSSNADPSVSSNADPSVSSNPDPSVSSNPDPSVSSNAHPSVSSNPHHLVSSNSDPPMSSNSDPHVSSNSDPPVSSNPHPSVSSSSDPPMSSNSDLPVLSNADLSVSSNLHPYVASVPHIRKCQSTNVAATPLTMTTPAQRNEYVRSLPVGFRLLNHLKPNNQCVNFFGVVTDVTAPRQSQGPDYYTKIYIVDPFFSHCSREIMWFESPLHMPNIYQSGEIVLFTGIKCRNYKGQLQLIKNNETKIVVVPRNDAPEVMKAARTPHQQLHPLSTKAIEVLKGWLAKNIHLFDAVKFVLLSSVLEVDKYINLCVKLCKMVYIREKVIFTVWDGTIPSITVPWSDVRKESNVEERVVFDVTSEFEEEKLFEIEVKGSFGARTNMAAFKLKPKAVLAFYGVLVKKRKDGHLKLLLQDSDRSPLGFVEVKSMFIQNPYHRAGRFNFKGW